MKKVLSLAWGLLLLLSGTELAWGQAALERLEKRLQKPAKAADAPAGPAVNRPLPEDDRPVPREGAFQPGYLGAMLDDRFDPDQGVRVVEADANGPAGLAGLSEDDLIVGVNGRQVKKMAELARVLDSSPVGAELTFDIERNGEKLRVEVALGERPAPVQRLAPQFGPQPDGDIRVAPEDDDPLQPAANQPGPRPDDRLRQLEQRIEQLERRLARIEELLREQQ
ncbi:MAG: PDZ domain-containing protein [Pirellulales bacterium]